MPKSSNSQLWGKGPYFPRVGHDSSTRLINLWPSVCTSYSPSFVNATFYGYSNLQLHGTEEKDVNRMMRIELTTLQLRRPHTNQLSYICLLQVYKLSVSLIIVKKLTASVAWCSCSWGSMVRRWILWDFNNFCCDKRSVDLRRLCLCAWSECLSLEDDAVDFSPIPSTLVIFFKSSSERWVLLPKISFKKNSLDGNFDSVSLCACPSSIQNPWTKWKIMLAEALSKSCWSRDLSSAPWWPCSSSSSFTSLKMLLAEKHWRRRPQQLI